jgi:mannose-6-phosphate isomerase-like protein (cupin superfamily)
MEYSRRKICLLLPALMASAGRAAENAPLPAKVYRLEDLPVRREGDNSFRSIFEGGTRTGFPLELHESDLAPGGMPHPPHRHVHEEMFLIREGTLEVTMAGRSTSLGPGSVAFVASGVEHGIRNVGTSHAQYFVLAMGSDKS